MQALSLTSTQGSAITYVTAVVLSRCGRSSVADVTTADPPGAGAGVSYALTAGPADVGHRVVVRSRLPDGRTTDVLGVLLRWDDAVVVVRDRSGVEHPVAAADVLAAKRIPPAPARRPGRRP